MGRKKRNRETDRRRRRTENRREREEQASDEKEHRNPMAIPDSPMPTNPMPDATMPSAKPTGAMPTNPIPQTSIRSLGSRGYGAESQQHILRATEETEADPHDLPDPVLDVLASGTGKSLDASIQRELEERMDADYSDVRIHTGSTAAKAADAIDAKAFTCGNAIVFNEGEYDPESPEGQHLLAHELAHVKQQTGAAISMMAQTDADLEIDPDPLLEREADQAAEEALSGDEPLIVNRMGTDVHIQRSAKEDAIYSPTQLRSLIGDELDERVPELVDDHLAERTEELEDVIDESAIDDDLAEALDLDPEENQSWFDRFTDGLFDKRRAVEGGVAATVASLTTIATSGAALPVLIAASGAFAAPALRGGTADAVVGEDGPLSSQELAIIVDAVEELIEGTETNGSRFEDTDQ